MDELYNLSLVRSNFVVTDTSQQFINQLITDDITNTSLCRKIESREKIFRGFFAKALQKKRKSYILDLFDDRLENGKGEGYVSYSCG